MPLAFLGLGTMGGPMAANLLAAGHPVTVWNRSPGRDAALLAAGATRAATPADAVRGARVVFVCVSDSPDVRAVVTEGENAAVAGLAEDAIVVDCSTISPDATRGFAAAVAEVGAHWVDAPVSGGPEGAKAGTLAMMCGADDAVFERVRPLLEILGGNVVHVGPVGSGQVTKAVNQVVIAGTYQALAEGLALAAKTGTDPERVVQAISGGAARSWVLENRGGNMLADSYPLGFKLALHLKDLRIALDTAAAAGAPLPVASLVADLEARLDAAGHGDEDVSVLARGAREAAELPSGPYQTP